MEQSRSPSHTALRCESAITWISMWRGFWRNFSMYTAGLLKAAAASASETLRLPDFTLPSSKPTDG